MKHIHTLGFHKKQRKRREGKQ